MVKLTLGNLECIEILIPRRRAADGSMASEAGTPNNNVAHTGD